MSERHVVVVGGGAAGAAAALAAHASGARVTVVLGKTGATSLTSGAIDGELDDDAKSIASALDLWTFERAKIATSAGTLRATHGRDRALADLDASKGAVLVARVAHPAWDARALAASYAETDARGFVADDVALVVNEAERAMRHAELAALHDDPARLAVAADRIKQALARGTYGAVLLPPWLGARGAHASELSALVGVPCGEVLVAFDGPAGLRFEHARDRSLQHARISTLKSRVKRVAQTDAACAVDLDDGAALEADAVVLATGGVLAGGIAYTPGEAAFARAMPPPSRAPFALGYDAPVTLGHDGHAFVVPGSVFGVAPESIALRAPGERDTLLERVGVLVDSRLRASDRVFACGDALEGHARTIASAIATGVAAGRAAAA